MEVRDADWNTADPTAVHDPADQADIAPGSANVWRSFPIACGNSCGTIAVTTEGDHAIATFVVAPANVPGPIVTTLNKALVEFMAKPETKQHFLRLG